MDGFTGFKSVANQELPHAATVMDPYHVVHTAIQALTTCRQRVQQETCGHRGKSGDPLYGARRTLLTGADLLTDRQRERLNLLFADDKHVEVHATWSVYQRVRQAYHCDNRDLGKYAMGQPRGDDHEQRADTARRGRTSRSIPQAPFGRYPGVL